MICIYCISVPVSWIEMSSTYPVVEKIEESKGGIRRRRKDTIMGEKKEQNDKQWSFKHYEENLRSSNTNPNKNRVNLGDLEG